MAPLTVGAGAVAKQDANALAHRSGGAIGVAVATGRGLGLVDLSDEGRWKVFSISFYSNIILIKCKIRIKILRYGLIH